MTQVYLKDLLIPYFKERKKYGISICSFHDVKVLEFDTYEEMSIYLNDMLIDEFTTVMYVDPKGIVKEINYES